MSESVKSDENLFLDNVDWSSKSLWKMMSANVTANIKQEIKCLVAVSYIFFKKYPQNLKYNIKEGVFFIWFSLTFVHPSWYCPLTTGVGEGFLNGKNLLSVTRVICQQFL